MIMAVHHTQTKKLKQASQKYLVLKTLQKLMSVLAAQNAPACRMSRRKDTKTKDEWKTIIRYSQSRCKYRNLMCLWARSSSAEGICGCSEFGASEKQLCQRWIAMHCFPAVSPHTATVRCRDVLGITSHTSSGAQLPKRAQSRV